MLALDGLFETNQRKTTMPKMRAVQIAAPNGQLELVERDVPEPGPGSVRMTPRNRTPQQNSSNWEARK
jgi:hypothetical protein